jgi:hypothetical protein
MSKLLTTRKTFKEKVVQLYEALLEVQNKLF